MSPQFTTVKLLPETHTMPPTTTTTTAKSTTRATTRTTTKPTTTTLPPPPPPCLGTCLPVSVASRCQAPSRLVVASGCRDDEICCDDFAKAPPSVMRPPLPPERPTRPGSQMPEAIGTLLSLFGGSANDEVPNIPPHRVTTPKRTTVTTTTTTIPTTVVTEPPECPGTCIAPLLSFTCFGR